MSTAEQADSQAGLEAQRFAIEAEAVRRGWELAHVFEDAGVSGKSLSGRPGLLAALGAVESDQAEALIVACMPRVLPAAAGDRRVDGLRDTPGR